MIFLNAQKLGRSALCDFFIFPIPLPFLFASWAYYFAFVVSFVCTITCIGATYCSCSLHPGGFFSAASCIIGPGWLAPFSFSFTFFFALGFGDVSLFLLLFFSFSFLDPDSKWVVD